MKKRVLSFILILTFILSILSVFVSCADNTDTSSNDGNNQSPNQNQTPSDEDQIIQSEFTPPDGIDYGGYKFRILGYDGEATGTWQIAAISEIIAEEETGEPIHDAVYRRNKEVEELYNITFDIVPVTYPNRGDFDTKFNKAVLAGDDLFDAAFLLGSSIAGILSKRNVTYDLLTIPSVDLSKSWWDQNSVKSLSIGNKLSLVMGDVNLYSFIAPIAIFANKKFMQDYNITNLYDLVREGKWTWDALHEISRQVTKDLNGDGIIDKNDQVGFATQPQAMYQTVIGSGALITPKNNEDIPVLSPNIEKISGILAKVVPIFKDTDSTIDANTVTGFNNVYFDFIMPKFRDGEIMFHVNQLLFSFELRNMNADFSILPLPKYDESQEKYGTVVEEAWGTYTVIPVTCTDTARTGYILDAMGYYSQKYVKPAYYDVTVTNKLVRDDETIEMLDIIMNNRVIDLISLYNWGDIKSIINGIATSGKADTFVSQFEKNENKINTAIQKTLDELQGS